MSVGEKRLPTGEEYLELEKDAFERSEFIGGKIFEKEGGGLNHNRISSNLNREIGNGLKGRGCDVFSSGMKVRVDFADAYFYPDLVGLCGEFEAHDGRDHTCRNPQFIIEILSDSTEAYDRGRKFLNYQTVPSLKEYVLVSQVEKVVEVFRKDGNRWIYEALQGDEAVLKLESVGCEVPISEIFGGVEFPEADRGFCAD